MFTMHSILKLLDGLTPTAGGITMKSSLGMGDTTLSWSWNR
jgi:hypothetical protein